MKENTKNGIILIIAILIMGSLTVSTIYLEKTGAQEEFDRAFHSGIELGYIQGKFTALEFIDYQFYEFDGQIYSIEYYDAINISDRGVQKVTENGTIFIPDQFVVYKMKLDLCGFPWCDPSPYVSDTSGIRYVSFRYYKDGPITEPGYYRFYYLDIDIMEITHWENG